MNGMKKWFFVCLMSALTLSAYSQTESGDQSAGVSLGYGFDSKNAYFTFDYRYNLTDEVRLTPSLSHYIKNDGLSAVAIDMNAHYVVQINDMFGFYPLAGIDLSFWKQRIADHLSANWTRFGVNLGLGAELYATKEITVGLEAKYTIIKDFDQAHIGLRVGYNF